LRNKIGSGKLLRLIGRYLRAGVELPDGSREATPLGVLQGGPLSRPTSCWTRRAPMGIEAAGGAVVVVLPALISEEDLENRHARLLTLYSLSESSSALSAARSLA